MAYLEESKEHLKLVNMKFHITYCNNPETDLYSQGVNIEAANFVAAIRKFEKVYADKVILSITSDEIFNFIINDRLQK